MQDFDFNRTKTRKQRIHQKLKAVKTFPISLTTVNFIHDVNLALLIRSAACFGAEEVLVIGSLPPAGFLRGLSGGTSDFLKTKAFPSIQKYLQYIREHQIKLVSLELCESSRNIYEYKFEKTRTSIVIGNEETGCPTEVLVNSDKVFYPSYGLGFCLNAATVGTAALSEYVRQMVQMS